MVTFDAIREVRIALTVEDFEQAVQFYRDRLGLAVVEEWQRPADRRLQRHLAAHRAVHRRPLARGGGRGHRCGHYRLPPRAGRSETRLYASGSGAERLAALNEYGLDVRVIGPQVEQASGLKMCYASLTKGLAALATQALTAGAALGPFLLIPDPFLRRCFTRNVVSYQDEVTQESLESLTLPQTLHSAWTRSERIQHVSV